MTLATETRDLTVEVVHNIRHLGEYHTRDGRLTRSTEVVRSASLARLTPEGVEQLTFFGVRTIVDLRSQAEREEQPTAGVAEAGITTIAAAVFEHDASPAGLADEQFPGYAPIYRQFLDTGRGAYRTLFEAIAERDGAVLFHCAAGKDRTGVAAALLLDLAGVPDEVIASDYARSSDLLTPLLPQWLPRMKERGVDESRARELMASPAGEMHATLSYIRQRWGSGEGYLASLGLSESTLRAVRARLVA